MDTPTIVVWIVVIGLTAWLLASLYKYESFDSAIMPKYPPAYMTERINTVTTLGRPIYPALPNYP